MRNTLGHNMAWSDQDLNSREIRELETSDDTGVFGVSDPLLNLVTPQEQHLMAKRRQRQAQARAREPLEFVPLPEPKNFPRRSVSRALPDHRLYTFCQKQSHSWLDDPRRRDHKYPLNRRRYSAKS
jgi:hypothetical protein